MEPLYKYIAYAMATSRNAEILCKPGYYVEQIFRREDNSTFAEIAIGNDVFDSISDPGLVELLKEHDGRYKKSFCKYFNQCGVEAI